MTNFPGIDNQIASPAITANKLAGAEDLLLGSESKEAETKMYSKST